MEKVYIVTYEYQDRHGERECSICGTFSNLSEAKKLLAKKRQAVLDDYEMTVEEMKANDFDITDSESTFFACDPRGGWDDININEESVQGSDAYVDIMFPFDGQTFIERINMGDVDPNHYDDLWDWWFSEQNNPGNEGKHTFELTADKHKDGNFAMTGMYINVYPFMDDNIIKVIPTADIKIHTSWSGTKTFEQAQP